MAKIITTYEYHTDRPRFWFWCPPCNRSHCFDSTWQWDGNVSAPTVTPSIKVTHGDGRVCHFFIKAGRLEYCGDCWHDRKGQTVDMADVDANGNLTDLFKHKQ